MKCNIVCHGPLCLHRFLDQSALYVPECSHKGSDVWGARAATEPVRLQEWEQKMSTVSQSAVGHSGPVACSLSGEEEEGACGALPGKLHRS